MATEQKFYQAEADALFPAGCKCGNNGGGDCDWCSIYYDGIPPDDNTEEADALEQKIGEACSGGAAF